MQKTDNIILSNDKSNTVEENKHDLDLKVNSFSEVEIILQNAFTEMSEMNRDIKSSFLKFDDSVKKINDKIDQQNKSVIDLIKKLSARNSQFAGQTRDFVVNRVSSNLKLVHEDLVNRLKDIDSKLDILQSVLKDTKAVELESDGYFKNLKKRENDDQPPTSKRGRKK